MTKIRCEVFASPDELRVWVADWAVMHAFVIALDNEPMSGEWRILEEPSELANVDSIRSVALLNRPGFKRRLQDALFVEFGKRHENTLKPSFVGGETGSPVLLGQWREIVADLKKKTGVGLWLVNPETGERAISKKIRCSPEVAQMNRDGLVLRAFAGWNVYEVFGE